VADGRREHRSQVARALGGPRLQRSIRRGRRAARQAAVGVRRSGRELSRGGR
jgi:hypothetical protein